MTPVLAALPAPTGALIGRDRDIDVALELLLNPDVRLLTLTGTGGAGKTSLALAVARAVAPAYSSVRFVPLASLTDPTQVVGAIGKAFGVQETTGTPLVAALMLALRGRSHLLVLDNFEHLADAAPVVAELLACAPDLTVLATSRAPLHLSCERLEEVSTLALPGKGPTPVARLGEVAAVRLFVERARAMGASFALSEENAASVAEICRQLDGLPLAIELAAARIRLLPPPALLSRLQPRLPLLTGGARDRPARQRTLRDTIAWSYNLLCEPERALFRGLAVFAGGCTLAAMEAVCAGPTPTPGGRPDQPPLDGVTRLASVRGEGILETASTLLNSSLLQRLAPAADEPRFTMLETIREFALEQLAVHGEEEALRARHAEFFAVAAEETDAHDHPHQLAPRLARLDTEQENLRAALAWSQGVPGAGEVAQRLVGSLSTFWLRYGRFAEGRRWTESALARSPSVVRMDVRAAALFSGARMAFFSGDPEAARPIVEESVALWRELGNQRDLCRALHLAGLIMRDLGELDAAGDFVEESAAIARASEDGHNLAIALRGLGSIAFRQEEYAIARTHWRESLEFFRQTGNQWEASRELMLLATVAERDRDFAQAVTLYEESVALRRDGGGGALYRDVVLSRSGRAAFGRRRASGRLLP